MDFEEYEDRIEYTVTEDKIFCDYGTLDYDVDEDTATVQAISVYRTGEGIGRKLVELFEDAVIKENATSAYVPATPSKEAISFWKKMKYKPSGDDDKYWAKKIINSWKEITWDTPQGVVVMEKDFKRKKIKKRYKVKIMISDLQKEKIAIQVIRTLYSQFDKFPEDISKNRNAPFHEAFLNAFANKLEGKVSSIPIFISLSSWMHGLNTSLGQSFFENVAHILCNGTKKNLLLKEIALQLSKSQKQRIGNIITDLTNGNFFPDSLADNEEITDALELLEEATGFTADIFFEDDEQVICVELKTVKPNKGVFKVEKQKILEAEAALRMSYPKKKVKFYIGFPFDPLSSEPTGYDKQRFMNYSVDFRKYFSESEFKLSAELWDFLSGTTQTMETILEIINSIATVNFVENFDFLQEKENAMNNKNGYINLLKKWFLLREVKLVENREKIYAKISSDKRTLRVFNQDIFNIKREDDKYKVEYNENRRGILSDLTDY